MPIRGDPTSERCRRKKKKRKRTLTPGSSLPDSVRQRLCGAPRSTSVTRSLRSARRSTYTVDGSGLEAPCKRFQNSQRLPRDSQKKRKRKGAVVDLEADGDVDAAAETGGDGARRQAEAGEEFREAARQVDARPLLGDDDAGAHASQVDAALLQQRRRCGQSFGAQLHDAVRAERVAHLQPRRNETFSLDTDAQGAGSRFLDR